MDKDHIYIPVPRKLYEKVVRLTSGRVNPLDLFENAMQQAVERLSEDWRVKLLARQERVGKPLVWGAVTLPHGTKMYMTYRTERFLAVVKDGRIEAQISGNAVLFDTASKWSRTVFGCNRNSWLDIRVLRPEETDWRLAADLRKEAVACLMNHE
jgi:hypothetical protein